MTIACLKGFGKMPFWRDKLTSFVNFFYICVGHGSREQFELVHFSLSNTLKGTESWRLLVRMKILDGVCLKVSLIFLNLSMKNKPNLFAYYFSSSKDGRTVAFDWPNILFTACHSFLPSPQFSVN